MLVRMAGRWAWLLAARRTAERAAERRLGEELAALAEIRRAIDALVERRRGAVPGAGTLLAIEALAWERYRLRLDEERARSDVRGAAAEDAVAHARRRLGEAARARMQIERLDERDRAEAALRADRSEARELDDVNARHVAGPGRA